MAAGAVEVIVHLHDCVDLERLLRTARDQGLRLAYGPGLAYGLCGPSSEDELCQSPRRDLA